PEIALFVDAEELDDEAGGRVEHQVESDDLAGGVRAAGAPIEDAEDREFGERLVKLRRVQRPIQGHADQLVGDGIGEGDRPGAVALDAPAAAGGEAAETADAVAERDA